jgi:hypothetical protein
MKDAILIEVAERWKREAREPADTDDSDYREEGKRIAKRECADDFLILIRLLGGGE